MKRAFLCCALLCCSLLSLASPAWAQSALEAYPDKVALVIRFESLDRFMGNVNDMLGAIGPGAAAASRDFESEGLGEMLELDDRTDVIDRQAPACVALFPLEVGGPPSCVLLKAKDETRLIRALLRIGDDVDFQKEELEHGFVKYAAGGRPVFVARWNDFWLITRHAEIAEAMELKSHRRRSMFDEVDERGRAVFEAGDAALVVNTAHLATKFKTEIEGQRKQVHSMIDDIPEEQLGNYAEVGKQVYHDLADLAYDGLFDSTWLVGNVTLSAEGGRLEALLGLRQDSKTDKLLAANKPSSLETLGLLPSGAPIFFGMALDHNQFLEPWARANYGAVADTPEAKAASEAATKLMREATVKSTVVSYALPGDGRGGLVASTLQEAGDVAKLREGFRQFVKAAGEIKTPLFTMGFSMKDDAEEYREHKIDLMSMKFKFLGEGELAVLGGFYDKVFGGESFETRVTTLGSLLVETTGNDASIIRKVLDGASSGEGVLALDETYGKTRDKLADEANAIFLIDAPRAITDSVRLLSAIEPFATGLRLAPFNFSVKPAPSYAGLSIGGEPQGLRLKAFVPVEQPRGILQIFAPGLQ